MPKKPRRRRPGGAGRTPRAAPSRPKPPGRRPEGATRAARAAGSRRKPSASQPEHRGRAARAPRLDADEERDDKVAPWEKWTAVTLSASRGSKLPVQFTVSGLDNERNRRYSELITSAAYKHFKLKDPPRQGEGPAAYLVRADPADEEKPAVKLLRVVYKELIVQFKPEVEWDTRNKILERSGFRVVERSKFAKNQCIVRHVRPATAGESLLAAADAFERFDEVEFAWPNSLAEYVRANSPARDFWLEKMGVIDSDGTRVGTGKASVVIAVLDDGVDIDHPNLASRVIPDVNRDFNFSPDEPDYSNPRPKINDQSEDKSNDYHGTQCAGVICSDGSEMGLKGVAPGCKLVAVRIFNGAGLVSEHGAVANAIRYATSVAHVISCSWCGPRHKSVVTAIDETSQGRGGKGTVFVGAAGNDGKLNSIDFPARHPLAVAVGACGPKNEVTGYANRGRRLDVVAPSSMNDTNVFTTDVSKTGWGFNKGSGPTGRFSDFGGTSAAAAMTAGVAALCLSKNSNLTADQIRSMLRKKAAKVGVDKHDNNIVYKPQGPDGRSSELGSGCIDAAAAVKEAELLLGS
jgi:subtilisin family serine protease